MEKLNGVYFYLTEGCNLSCRHCWITSRHQAGGDSRLSLSLDLFKSIIEQAKPLGLSMVKLTGGEPLLNPHISQMLDYVQGLNLRLIIETNGVLCTPELCRKISACKNSFVSVSIDGADRETHEWVRRVEGSYEAAKQGVRNLVAAGLKPQIIMSIMKRNEDQLEAVVRLAESLGAGSVKFNIVQPYARGIKMHEEGETPSVEGLIELGRWVESDLSASTNLRLIFSYPVAFKPLSLLLSGSGNHWGLCGIFGIIGVLANGSYALCGIGETMPDLVFGHAVIDRLEDVWKNHPTLRKIREGLPKRLEGICSECLLKNNCLGNCIAQNYYGHKNLWEPFWFCQQAQENGLFPKSRLLKEPR